MRRTFVIVLALKIPPHLKYVATLPCEVCGLPGSPPTPSLGKFLDPPLLSVRQNAPISGSEKPVTSRFKSELEALSIRLALTFILSALQPVNAQ